MKLSVIILNYNVRYFLELCLQSVQQALVNLNAEIIVVDNASSDNSCAMVKQRFPDVIVVENETNEGFSKGNNIGFKRAKGDYICVLNPDTVVAEDTFTELLKFAESKDQLGIVGCRLIDGIGNFLPESKRNIPMPKVAVKKMLGVAKSYYANTINEDEIGKVSVLAGAFMLMKRNVFNAVNGFDEAYFMYGEDIDLSYRMLKSGYDNYYFGKASIIHFKGESTLKDKIYAKRFYGAMQIFYNKYFKSNTVFDALVWLGTKFGVFFKRRKAIAPNASKKPQSYMFISDIENNNLEKVLQSRITLQSKIENYADQTEYILDSNYLSFKTIINIISNKPKVTATFKILSKNADFIIGSNCSNNRGEVILLK